MKRFPFLDWMRGVAVLVMIQCHTFNSFTRLDLRDGGPYVLSQFVGGMAAPLFLFMAGMTSGFQMDSLDRRQPDRTRRWFAALRRAGYILGIAYLFRLTNWMGSYPGGDPKEIFKVDILNAMGLAMLFFAGAAAVNGSQRARAAGIAALAIAVAAPLMANLPWDGAPALLREYLVPVPGRGHFPFFPYAAYVGFGVTAGAVVKQTPEPRFERMMQWAVLVGFGLVFTGQYFANLPYSIYEKSNFWTDSPALPLIRVGIMLVLMSACYLWTEHIARPGWSWINTLGRHSLLVYWVHVILVYGALAKPVKRTMSIPQTTLATAGVVALMVALCLVWERLPTRKKPALRVAEAAAPPVGSRATSLPLPESG